jgi:hypothetical protein
MLPPTSIIRPLPCSLLAPTVQSGALRAPYRDAKR